MNPPFFVHVVYSDDEGCEFHCMREVAEGKKRSQKKFRARCEARTRDLEIPIVPTRGTKSHTLYRLSQPGIQ